MTERVNLDVADRLEELAQLLAEQGANPFRVRAYRGAVHTVRELDRPVSALLETGGLEALEALPGIGVSIARTIRDILVHGRSAMLDRLRGEGDPMAILTTVPGIGRGLAERIHHELGIETLEELETAAHDGRLAKVEGFGGKRLAGIRDSLARRLARIRTPQLARPEEEPPVGELLEVDREYRAKAAAGELRTIAPRRFNPERRAWLPVLHAVRGDRHYTALFSNTARAHELGRTHDWVVLYVDGGHGERQRTVITADRGALRGRRIVRGREAECEEHYRHAAAASGTRRGAG